MCRTARLAVTKKERGLAIWMGRPCVVGRMKRLVRAVAALNAVFQVAVGALSVGSPHAAAAAFKVDLGTPALSALIRMFGGLLLASGLISGLIARNVDESAALRRVYAVCLAVNVTADLCVIGAGEMAFGQLAAGMILEAVLAALLLTYRGAEPKPSATRT
jgi:hypothetical protein